MNATQKPSKEEAAESEEQHHDLIMKWGTALAE